MSVIICNKDLNNPNNINNLQRVTWHIKAWNQQNTKRKANIWTLTHKGVHLVINVGETKCKAQTKEKINKANEDKKNTYLKL